MSATSKSPLIRLNNGVQVPALGLGVYLSPRDQTASAVRAAIGAGYRLIDTAAAYGNEAEVGEGIVRSEFDRADLFVTTKLWIADHGYDQTMRAFETSLDRLRLDYLDMYLLHWPVPSNFEATIGSYRAAERLLADGRVRAIGVCTALDRLDTGKRNGPDPDVFDMEFMRARAAAAKRQRESA